MINIRNYWSVVVIAFLLTSCGRDENLVQAENTVQSFFSSVAKGDAEGMISVYPEFSTFETYYKSDSVVINDCDFVGDTVVNVSLTNHFTNGYGKQSDNEIKLYLYQDSVGSYSVISNSDGMSDHSSNEMYEYAVNTGCVLPSDSLDVQMNLKIQESKLLAYYHTLKLLRNFERQVTVTDWSWDSGYSGSASGKGIVKNSTTFTIPEVEYEIEYKTSAGAVVTTDDGRVSYDPLKAGQSQAFTFYTSYVGDASTATISLKFDEQMILDYILQGSYAGDEYDQYKSMLKDAE
jgi:hypothetical protein